MESKFLYRRDLCKLKFNFEVGVVYFESKLLCCLSIVIKNQYVDSIFSNF